jgi:site-specific recombinase XerD
MSALDRNFQAFLRERVYLHNVAPKTATWYRDVWAVFMRWWRTLPDPLDRASLDRSELQEFVIHLRQRGVSPVSCNCYIRGLNAFCRWLHHEGHAPHPVRLPPLKLEKRLRATHDDGALKRILD